MCSHSCLPRLPGASSGFLWGTAAENENVLQAQLRPARVAALRRAVPQLTEQQLAFMQRSPLRMPQQGFTEEPTHRVLQEVCAFPHAVNVERLPRC